MGEANVSVNRTKRARWLTQRNLFEDVMTFDCQEFSLKEWSCIRDIEEPDIADV
jgi:hypothetical protein